MSNKSIDSNNTLFPPFEAYQGDEPYVFISYAHRDNQVVFQEIKRLHDAGYRIWYDEGIDPGNEWPDEIAAAIEKCGFFIVYISSHAVNSKNVRNEINFALNKNKAFVAVHLKEKALPLGLELRMGDIQAVMKYRMSEEFYYKKLDKTLPPSLIVEGKEREHDAVDAEKTDKVIVETQIVTTPSSIEDVSDQPQPEYNLLQKGKKCTNSLAMEFVHIEPGSFIMGSPSDESDGGTSEKAYQVTLTKDFYMQTTPVTQGQWKTVMENNPSKYQSGDDYPVEQVSWNDTQEFIEKLNHHKGTEKYRLPTEAEWEYACRAGSTFRFCFGDDESMIDDYAWYSGNSRRQTQPVAQKKSNAWELYDMHGNVWEWCQDWDDDYPSSSISDPSGSLSGSARVIRGGSYDNSLNFCCNANRNRRSPGFRFNFLGFRLALTL